MKKSILFLAVASVFALASCGEKAPEVTEAPVDSTAVTAVDTTAAVDTAAVDTAAATTEAAPAEAAH